MNDIRIQIAYEICEILNNNNIKNFIDFGTLLGFYREGKIIENDYDFDIFALIDKSFNFKKEFKNLIKKYDLFLFTRQSGKNIILKHNNFMFEIYKIGIKNKKYYPLCMPKNQLPTFFIDNLEKISDKNGATFNCPRYINKYLTHRYGENFMTPQSKAPDGKDWCYVDYNIIEPKKEYTAYTYGVFDLFHIGHLNLFKRIKTNFDKLIVGIHNDEQVMTYKNKPIIPYKERLEIVKSNKYVDGIIENAPLIINDELMNQFDCDYVIAGIENENYIKKYYQVDSEKLYLINRTEGISSSSIKNKLINN